MTRWAPNIVGDSPSLLQKQTCSNYSPNKELQRASSLSSSSWHCLKNGASILPQGQGSTRDKHCAIIRINFELDDDAHARPVEWNELKLKSLPQWFQIGF